MYVGRCVESLFVALIPGVNSFLAYMSDEGFSVLRDSDLYRLFRQCKHLNALPLVHAENGALIEEVASLTVVLILVIRKHS